MAVFWAADILTQEQAVEIRIEDVLFDNAKPGFPNASTAASRAASWCRWWPRCAPAD
jgi:hypothetical protein